MTKKPDELLNSNYDGIHEYDNDLPRWWLGIFYITIAFAVVYTPYWLMHIGPTQAERLASSLAEIKKNAPVAPAAVTDDELLALTKSADHVKAGGATFALRCTPCHGPDGGGIVGPNLTDDFWIHGSKISDTYKTVTNGVLDKGMLAWKGVLTEEQIRDVVAYIYTLRGTTPKNPKAPQGDKANG